MKVIRVRNHIRGYTQYVCTTATGPYRLLSVSDPTLKGVIRLITAEEMSSGIGRAIARGYEGPGRRVEIVEAPKHLSVDFHNERA